MGSGQVLPYPDQCILMMSFGFHLVHDVFESTILADNESDAHNAHKLPAHKFFQRPDAVFLGNGVVFI